MILHQDLMVDLLQVEGREEFVIYLALVRQGGIKKANRPPNELIVTFRSVRPLFSPALIFRRPEKNLMNTASTVRSAMQLFPVFIVSLPPADTGENEQPGYRWAAGVVTRT
jgi:hypothetical protein